jgi:hypothetical protein
MSENVREVIAQHYAFYEVTPYLVVLEERRLGAKAARRTIQAGFDIDVYGIKASLEPEPSPDYVLVYGALRKAVKTVLPHANNHCSIEVIPFPSTVILDTRRHLQPQDMLRIRITHGRGLDQAAGASEESALKEIEERLHDLGVSLGRNGA